MAWRVSSVSSLASGSVVTTAALRPPRRPRACSRMVPSGGGFSTSGRSSASALPASRSSSIALTGAERRRRQRQRAEAEPDQRQRPERLGGQLAAQRHRLAAGARPCRRSACSARSTGARQRIEAVGDAPVAAVGGEQELHQIVGADREEIHARRSARRAGTAATAPRPWRRPRRGPAACGGGGAARSARARSAPWPRRTRRRSRPSGT